ncbi:MAG: hypothetical protein RI990_387 [Planctomycetota bacterium]|jgi:hypothetical protein
MTRSGRSPWHRIPIAIAAHAVGVGAASAQTPGQLAASMRPMNDPATELQTLYNVQDAEFRQAYFSNTPIAERLLLDYGGYFRYGFSAIDDAQSRSQLLNTYDLRLYGRVELDGWIRAFGRLRFQYNDWNTIGDFAPSGEGWQVPIGELYWAEFDLGNWMASQDGLARSWSARARAGRQFIFWGSGLTLANYMYAATADATFGALGFSGMVGLTAGNDTVDWDTSRPGYDSDTARLFLGGKVDVRIGEHAPYFFYLAQFDQNSGQTAVLPPGVPPAFQVETRFNYESQYWGVGSNGALGPDILYRVEFALETGSTLSDPIKHDASLPPDQLGRPQETVPILAQAGLAGLTWLARDRGDTRLDLQLLAGSGSRYRLDSGNTYGGIDPGRTDTSFNSLGYVNTGLVFAPDPANLLIPSISLSGSPFKGNEFLGDTRISATAFMYVRWDSLAPISVPTNLGGSNLVGSEFDVNVDWRIFSDLNMSARYGVFVPNQEVFSDTEDEPRQFFYVGVTYAF